MCLVFLFEAKKIFSQDKNNIQLFRPSIGIQQANESVLIKQWVEYYKKSREVNELYVYKAVVLNSPSVCEVSTDKKKCLDNMNELLEIYNLAIGRCEAIEAEDRDICRALRKNDCSPLVDKGDKRKCEGYLDLDLQTMKEAFRIEGERIDIKSESRRLAYYSAFKNNNALACRQLLKNDDYCHKMGCYILTSPNPQSVIDKFALDFAYYCYSYSKNKKSACSNISDEYIRKHCEKGTDFSRFINTYFLED